MGKKTGVCAGVGGSQHIKYRNFYSNGILGGIVPAATGMALAEKLKGTGTIVVAFVGDGALGEGVVYESFNIAALWELPICFVIEANGFAQSTPTALEHAGNLADRPRAFGINTEEMPADNPVAVYDAASRMTQTIRRTSTPGCLVLQTYRLGPHSKGDDSRSPEALAKAAASDPLNRMLNELPSDFVSETEDRIKMLIEDTVSRCLNEDLLTEEDFLMTTGVYA
jgi:TPP-dependent pyruvate/acetoin dehydrogenase alpha subunit